MAKSRACHLESESVNTYLNVGTCLIMSVGRRGDTLTKGNREVLLGLS